MIDTITMLDCLALGFVAGVALSLLVAWLCTIPEENEPGGPTKISNEEV